MAKHNDSIINCWESRNEIKDAFRLLTENVSFLSEFQLSVLKAIPK